MGRTFGGGVNETRKEIKNCIVTKGCSENASFDLSGCEEQQKINAKALSFDDGKAVAQDRGALRSLRSYGAYGR